MQWLVKGIVAISLVLLVVGHGLCAEERLAIGNLKEVKGAVLVIRAGSTLTGEPGQPIYENDTLQTGGDGAVGLIFNDDTIIALGPDTIYEITAFDFRPEMKSMSFISRISKGTLQYISGTIAKLAPKSVSMNSPLGVIGTRGTRFLVKIAGEYDE